MAFTMYRSLHVVQTTLDADGQVLGYAALAGLDGGLLAWTVYKMKSARGDAQHAIAMFMIVLEWIGVAGLVVADTLLTADAASAPAYIRVIALWCVPVVISLNVGAIITVHMVDPQRAIEAARRTVQDEIQRQVAEQLKEASAQIAGQVSPTAAKHHAEGLLAEYVRTFSGDGKDVMTFAKEGDEGDSKRRKR
jgi:hypothetical protein